MDKEAREWKGNQVLAGSHVLQSKLDERYETKSFPCVSHDLDAFWYKAIAKGFETDQANGWQVCWWVETAQNLHQSERLELMLAFIGFLYVCQFETRISGSQWFSGLSSHRWSPPKDSMINKWCNLGARIQRKDIYFYGQSRVGAFHRAKIHVYIQLWLYKYNSFFLTTKGLNWLGSLSKSQNWWILTSKSTSMYLEAFHDASASLWQFDYIFHIMILFLSIYLTYQIKFYFSFWLSLNKPHESFAISEKVLNRTSSPEKSWVANSLSSSAWHFSKHRQCYNPIPKERFPTMTTFGIKQRNHKTKSV